MHVYEFAVQYLFPLHSKQQQLKNLRCKKTWILNRFFTTADIEYTIILKWKLSNNGESRSSVLYDIVEWRLNY